MTVFSIIRMRVKPEHERDFLALNDNPGAEVERGLQCAHLVRTEDYAYCLIGQWDSMSALAAGHPAMIGKLEGLRHMLDEFAGGVDFVDAFFGESVAALKARAPGEGEEEYWSG